MLDKLLFEKSQIAGISRVTGISEPWLQRYINRKYERVPHAIDRPKKRPSHAYPETMSFTFSKKDIILF